MATKRVSVSGLPQLSSSDLINDPSLDKTRTSFLVSSRRKVNDINTSYQLDYAQLYTAISSQIANQFNIKPTVGANDKPIYLTGQKFAESTKNVGSSTKPIYMSAGKLQESNENIGIEKSDAVIIPNDGRPYDSQQRSGMTPIYMKNGALTAATKSIGRSTVHDVQPVFMLSGNIIATQHHVGNVNRPTYMEYGHIKPCFTGKMGSNTQPVFINANGQFTAISGNAGDSTTPIYMSNGQFIPCDDEVEELPRDQSLITGKRFEIKQTVFFSDKDEVENDWVYTNNELCDHYNDPTAEFRVVHPSKSLKDDGTWGRSKCFFRGLDNPVNFKIDEAGWYLVHCEASSKPMAVGIKVNNKWSHEHPYFKKYVSNNPDSNEPLMLPNLIYIDSNNRQTIDPIFHLEEGVEIGVYSCLSNVPNAAKYTTDTWYSSSSDTSKYFKGKGQLSANIEVTLNGHTFESSVRGTKNAPFLNDYFTTWIKNNPGSHKSEQFWIYTKPATLYKYYPASTGGSWSTASYTAEPKHKTNVLSAINDKNVVYDYNYAASNAGKEAIWGTSNTTDIYNSNSYAWVMKGGTKRHYTGITKDIKQISYIQVNPNNEKWGNNDLVELIYLS